jgi:hypothetical protein
MIHFPSGALWSDSRWKPSLQRAFYEIRLRRQQRREAELMPIRIEHVKESLAPRSISGRFNGQRVRLQHPVLRVRVVDSENNSPPPLRFIYRARYQVDETFAGFQAAESCTFAAIHQLKTELPIEFDRTNHVPDRQGYCTDVLDHCKGSSVANTVGIIPAEAGMRFEAFSFGSIRVDGITYEHDVVIDRGQVRKRKKKPSKRFRDEFGHTPLPSKRKFPGSVVGS